jgi:hypothetical protein
MSNNSDLDSDELHVVKAARQVDDQISLQTALQDLRWREAMQEEFNSLIANMNSESSNLPLSSGKQNT